jgi:hypothetical protein
MKHVYLAIVTVLAATALHSQCSVLVTGSTNVTCNGACDGSASVSTIGVPTFNYLWAPGGQTVQNPTNLCAGTHTVTMMDANSCVATATVMITEPLALAITTTQTDVTCNGACDGTANSTVTGGTAPYTYMWMPGGLTTANVTALCEGAYTLTVTDNNGCTANATVTITQPNVLTMVISTNNVSCFGACDGVANSAPSGGTAPYTYAWTPGGQNTSLCPGTYTVTVTDANGCMAVDSAMITEPPALTLMTSNDSNDCFGDCTAWAQGTVGGGTPGYSYMWTGGQTTDTATGLCAGGYMITVTDANGCTITDSIWIYEPTELQVLTTVTDASSIGGNDGSITAASSGGTGSYTYLWSTGATTATITGLSLGYYDVCVTDSMGCVTCVDSIYVNDGTGIHSVTESTLITIYPNPANSNINLKVDVAGTVRYTLYDVTGKAIATETYTTNGGTHSINIANQPAGVYLLEVDVNGSKVTRKVSKY